MSTNSNSRQVFVTGATGYMGQRLIAALLEREHHVHALARAGSEKRLPEGCKPVIGNALDAATYSDSVAPCDTFVHLIGVSHPSPAKAEQFRTVDLASLRAAVIAAKNAGIAHFVYVSVAHPAPVMKVYQQVRQECELILAASGMNATILRPWYVLGPGHRWPYALLPFYWLLGSIPRFRQGAERLGLVTLKQMIQALRVAVESPVSGTRILEVPAIRASGQ